MVSLLWKACSEGDLQKAQELLQVPNSVDIEVKDFMGITPLVEAVKNGHVEIVKLLLEKGADPTSASKDGRSDTYTSEPAILDMLQAATNKTTSVLIPPQPFQYTHDTSQGVEKHFYSLPPPPPEPLVYYPPMNPNINEGATYYLPSPGGPISPGNGMGHLPPPEIARMIPCRYFPACRYGSQCIFSHPQGPYFQGAMPPYPPYDPMANPYGPYYAPPPPSFQQLSSPHSVPPMTPPPNTALHNRSSSDVTSPVRPSFVPSGPPSNYPQPIYPPGEIPMQYPVPPHPQPTRSHHSPNLYEVPPIAAPYVVPFDGSFAPQEPLPNGQVLDDSHSGKVENPSPQNSNHSNGVNGIEHHRRNSTRRPSFKLCLFFPSGRCKNGNECRFSHVLDGVPASAQQNFLQGKGGQTVPHRASQPDATGNLSDKLTNLNLRDDQRPKNGVEGTGRPYTGENGRRTKFQGNGKHHYLPGLNGHGKRSPPFKQQVQRVPNADEFPALGLVATSKSLNGSGPGTLTAAQVLQAPPPSRKDGSMESSTRATTPESIRGPPNGLKEDDVHQSKLTSSNKFTPAPSYKLPVLSFALGGSVSSPDTVKEVSVSA